MLVIIIVVFAIAFIKNRNADTNGTPIVDNTENNNDSNYEGDALLKSLEEVKGDFYCSNCKNLKSLEGAPEKIKGFFYCVNCKNLTITDSDNKKYRLRN